MQPLTVSYRLYIRTNSNTVYTPKLKHQIKLLGVALLLGLSIASFTYLTTVNNGAQQNPHDIYVEDIDDQEQELLPDVRIIKMLMNKTIDFVTQTPRL